MPEWSNDTVLHVAVFNKDPNDPSLLGRSDILIDWIETPGTSESVKWQEVYFTADDSEWLYMHTSKYLLHKYDNTWNVYLPNAY
uniref:SJCHGC01994 protein n=1 Tax=Schistosoma japonicum TaxID=6182 RepID=Q5BTD1_SCHJA|nr:SJCHGC01994 protein [Schistosoma japonicum]